MDTTGLRRSVTALVAGGTVLAAAAIAANPLPGGGDAAPAAAPAPSPEAALAARERAAVQRLAAAEAHLRLLAAAGPAVPAPAAPAAPVVSVAPQGSAPVVASGSS
jgi:hypothetical protein